MKPYSPLFEESMNTPEMVAHFYRRTNNHIELVRKYLAIIELAVNEGEITIPGYNFSFVRGEESLHDKTKFMPPEFDPYVRITWNYKLKDEGKSVVMSEEEKVLQNKATNHHIKTNPHHPEYWDGGFESVPLNDRDSKTVGRLTDGTKMPLPYVACMVADWMAMSEEKGTSPYEWAKKNIGIRWGFTPEQESLIYSILDVCWK